ncbi:MAG: sugar ABC transporter permease [Clostridiales bacterium]|jgi:putative multiple sugar transport system permease protein|nr:sugar ABC transporter permease [Clostridiales bacterium]
MTITLIAITLLFEFLTKGVLLSPQNITNLIMQNSCILLLSIGMMLCILTGGNIDLSVGSVLAFVGAINGKLIITKEMPIHFVISLVIFLGFLIGAWQGFWIAYVRIPSFIVTLSGMLIFRGLAVLTLKGMTLTPFPNIFQEISGGFVFNFLKIKYKTQFVTYTFALILTIIYICLQVLKRNKKERRDNIYLFLIKNVFVCIVIFLCVTPFANFKGIPIILIILGIITLFYSFVTQKTIYGRYVYAVGGNEKAAKCSGIDTNKVLFYVYVNMSVLAAIAGIVFSSRTNSASPQAGINFELDAVTSCYIGGASASGGIGTIMGAIIGGTVMGVLNNGMSIMGIASDVQMTIKGIALITAVAFDVISKNSKVIRNVV